VKALIPTTIPWITLVRCLGATSAMVLVVTSTIPDAFLAKVLLSVVLYFGLLFVLKELTVGELRTQLDL